MTHFEVDPDALVDTANEVRRCVDVAHQFSDHGNSLYALAEDCGSDHLRTAIEHFIGRWSHGMRLVARDGGNLAAQLDHAVNEYRRVETDISRQAR
jgi:hypothetical protein